MTRRFICMAAFAAWACVVPAISSAQSRSSQRDSLHLRVLAVHDFHGALRPSAYPWSRGRLIGGMAALKSLLDSAAVRCGCVTIRLDGGDQMQGTLDSNLSHGAAVVRAFNLLGLDAAAIGNHELDWGEDTLRARRSEANYAWLAANVFEKRTGGRPGWAPPFAIIEKAGVRIGVIGYLTSETARTLRAAASAPYDFRRGLDGIREALDAVRRSAPDFIVIVAHAGGQCDNRGCGGELVELAQSLDSAGVHLMVGGHAHTTGFGVVNGIPIVRAGSDGRAVSIVDLFRRPDGTRRFQFRSDTVFADAVTPDRAMTAMLQPYLAAADSLALRPIATLRDSLRSAQPSFGALIADAQRVSAGADFAIYNPGGIRSGLPAGMVNYAQLYRVLPFGNMLHKLTLSGTQVRAVVEQGVSGVEGGPFHFSGMVVRYDPNRPVGSRVTSLTRTNGSAIDDHGTYTLGIVDFLAEGGSGFGMLTSIQPERLAMSALDALIAHLQRLPQPVIAPTDTRVVTVR